MTQDINLHKTNNSYYLIKIKSKEELKNFDCDGFLIDTNSMKRDKKNFRFPKKIKKDNSHRRRR